MLVNGLKSIQTWNLITDQKFFILTEETRNNPTFLVFAKIQDFEDFKYCQNILRSLSLLKINTTRLEKLKINKIRFILVCFRSFFHQCPINAYTILLKTSKEPVHFSSFCKGCSELQFQFYTVLYMDILVLIYELAIGHWLLH